MFSADKKSYNVCSSPHVTALDTQHGLHTPCLKLGISSTKVVRLQPSTIQPGPQRRHFQYSSCTTTKHNPARTRNDAFPVIILKLYHNQAQPSHDPKRGNSSTKVELQPSRIQPGNQQRHFQYYSCTTARHNPARTVGLKSCKWGAGKRSLSLDDKTTFGTRTQVPVPDPWFLVTGLFSRLLREPGVSVTSAPPFLLQVPVTDSLFLLL